MPNTFSMSPNYVRRFVQTNRLQSADRNVFHLLRSKAERMSASTTDFKRDGIVVRADAKTLADAPEFQEYVGRVDLALTSPPYLNVVNYALQNWIRMWFLREDLQDADQALDDDLTLGIWTGFAQNFVRQIKRMLAPNGVAVLVIGDVIRSGNSVVSPARELIRQIYHSGSFSYIGCLSDHLHAVEKTTRIWKETKGRATSVDRVVILSDATPTFRDVDLLKAFAIEQRLFEEPRKAGPIMDADRIAESARSFAGLDVH